jgi:tripartite ATP-independent transporter DctP family solute receptor
MKRKSIYLLLCVALVFSLLAGCASPQQPTSAPVQTTSAPAQTTTAQDKPADQVFKIDFAIHTNSGTNENKTLLKFKELVEERSEGRIEINLFPDAVLGTELENLEQVKVNEVQMSIFGDNLVGQLAPEFSPTIVPFIYKNIDDVFAAWDGELGDLIKESVEAKGNQYVVALQARGARNLTASKAINTPADLRGLKIRVPEISSWITMWGALGAIPTPIAWSETYSALQTGVANGQENPISNIYANKIYEVNNYVMMTEHLYNVFHWTINKDFYNSLPSDLQDIIMDSAAEATEWGDSMLADAENALIEEMVSLGVNIIEVDKVEFINAASSAIETVAATWDPRVKAMVDAYLGN